MFALLMRSGRRSTVAPGLELDTASAEEIRQAVTGFVAYFGSYEVDNAAQTVSFISDSFRYRFGDEVG
jgi:hypothetical protein